MIKCAKKFVNQLTRGKYAGKVDPSRWQSFGVVRARVLRHFSVFPRIHAPILPTNYKKITKHFQCGYKIKTKLKHRTHYAIFQNRRICADRPIIWLGALCGLCILPYINGLRSALVGECGSLGCLCVLGLYGR